MTWSVCTPTPWASISRARSGPSFTMMRCGTRSA
jgi:hypothetical protein